MFSGMDLHGRSVLLTGAIGGLGHAIARRVKARAPEDVATAVVQVTVHKKAEIDVMDPVTKAAAAFGPFAPMFGRFAPAFGPFAPRTSARLSSLFGAERVAAHFAERQREKR